MQNNINKSPDLSLKDIKVISFDVDGTLYDYLKVMKYALSCVLMELTGMDPFAASRLNVEKLIEIAKDVLRRYKNKFEKLEKIRLEVFRQALILAGKPDEDIIHRLNDVYMKHRYEDIKLFEDVKPALKALSGNYSIGLISNGNSYPKKYGLADVFQFSIFAQDYGVEKPDPALFHLALQKTGCEKHQILHAGDSLTEDVQGAKNAGIISVWVNRTGEKNIESITPDFEISNLSELVDILKG